MISGRALPATSGTDGLRDHGGRRCVFSAHRGYSINDADRPLAQDPERQQYTTIPGTASAGHSRPVAIIISMAVARKRSDCGFDRLPENYLASKRT